MKTIISVVLLSCIGITSKAQQNFPVSVNIPPIQSVSILNIDERPLQFNTISDYANGIIVNNYCSILVKSNFGWKLSVKVVDNTNFGTPFPSGIISIQQIGQNNFIPISGNSTPILNSTNSLLENTFSFNLKIDPKLNYTKKDLLFSLIFEISPQ